MKPIRLGLFCPERPEGHLQVGDPTAAIGCLHRPVHAPFMAALRARNGIELLEDLNFRRAFMHDGRVWCGDICLSELDAFAWYCEVDRRPGSFDLEVLHTLARTVRVIRDPARFEVALDKYRAHMRLRDAGLRVPECVLFDHRCPERMRQVLDNWGCAVLKPRRGGWGSGVTAVSSWSQLRDIVDYMRSTAGESADRGYFLERFYPNDMTRWVSATVIDGQVSHGYKKLAPKYAPLGEGGFKILDADEVDGDVALGELLPIHVELAQRAATALGLGLIGFDFIWVDGAPMIVDENTSPGNYADIYAALGVDVGARLADWIAREAAEGR